MSDMDAFLEQNDLCAATLTPQNVDDLEPYAQHYSGGLVVVLRDLGDDRYVKMHDSWGDDGQIVVHAYNTLTDEDETERYFDAGWQAAEHFFSVD